MTDLQKRSRTHRVLRATGTTLGTLTALGLAGTLAWMGSAEIAARAERLPTEATVPPVPVVTAPLVQSALSRSNPIVLPSPCMDSATACKLLSNSP